MIFHSLNKKRVQAEACTRKIHVTKLSLVFTKRSRASHITYDVIGLNEHETQLLS